MVFSYGRTLTLRTRKKKRSRNDRQRLRCRLQTTSRCILDVLRYIAIYCRDILNIVAIFKILSRYTIYCCNIQYIAIYWQYIAKYLNMQYIAICATRILQSLRYMRTAYCNIYCLAKKSSRILTIYGSPSLTQPTPKYTCCYIYMLLAHVICNMYSYV